MGSLRGCPTGMGAWMHLQVSPAQMFPQVWFAPTIPTAFPWRYRHKRHSYLEHSVWKWDYWHFQSEACGWVAAFVEKKKVKVLVTQLCLTLWDPTDCSLPGFSVHGISQARIVEWVAIPFSRGSSPPRDRTQVSCVAGRFFIISATWEALRWLFSW